jgi:hypothetical protein
MRPVVVIEAIQFRAYRPRQTVEPIVEPILDLLDAAGVACRGHCLPAPGQVDGLLQERAQGLQVRLFLGGDDIVESLTAAKQVAVTTTFGDFKHVVAFQAVHHQVAVEIGAEDLFGDLMATGTHATADDVDGRHLAAKHPQPGVEAADAPAGLVGMDDMASSRR